MRLFESLFRKARPGPATADARSDPLPAPNTGPSDGSTHIRVFDKFGRELFITKEQWRTNVLPGSLAANSADPERLSAIVISALNDGFCADILEAAEHLHRIDPVYSRGTCVYGIALMKNDRLDAAERILRSHIEKHGADGPVLTNLAKVYSARNEIEKSDATLWRALEIDPNQENGLALYVSTIHERSGKEAAMEASRRVAAIPGSWRAQLWLARAALESQDTERAMAYYQESLSRVGPNVPTDFLMQMSGDLGSHGLLVELLQLSEPHFVPETHGLQVGNNLIKANLDIGRIENASRILNQLYALRRPDWKEHLSFWDTEIANVRIAKAPPVGQAPLNVTMLMSEGALWLSPSSPASTLFPAKPDGRPIVCLLGCTAETAAQSDNSQRQMANAAGRMSRALPLFLAEQIEFATEACAQTFVPWAAEGDGFVLINAAWSDEDAADCTVRGQVKCDYVVTIHLMTRTEPWDVRLRLVRLADRKCIGNLSASLPSDKPEEGIPELARLLVSLLARQAGVATQALPSSYRVPEGANLRYYLLRLEQLLAVRCGGLEGTKEDFLHGEREILDGNLSLCLACKDNVVTRVLLAQTLLAMKKVRPDVLPEFQEKVSLLQEEHPLPEPAQGVLKRLFAEIAGA